MDYHRPGTKTTPSSLSEKKKTKNKKQEQNKLR